MDNEFLIFDYLDGELSSTQEESFFNQLSQNEELRNEFKQQLALKNSFVKDLKTFSPSPEQTMSLFTKLGISATAVGGASQLLPASTSTSFLSSLGAFLTGSIFKSVIATILVSLGTFYALLQLDIIEWYDEEGNSILTKNDKSLVDNSNTPKYQNPSNIDNTNKIPYESNKPIEKIIYKNNYIFTIDTLKLKGEEKQMAIEYLNKLDKLNELTLMQNKDNSNNLLASNDINYSQLYELNYNNYPRNKTNIHQESMNSFAFHNISNDLKIPILFELGGNIYNNSTINEREINRDYSQINNSRIGFLFDVGADFYLGSDFKKESYYQNFNYIDAEGRNLEYFQKPEFNLISATARYAPEYLKYSYSLMGFEQRISPFIQASYGGDIDGGGNVSRAATGINLYFTRKLYLQGIIDYSNLNYRQDDKRYNSSKFGASFGIGFDFNK